MTSPMSDLAPPKRAHRKPIRNELWRAVAILGVYLGVLLLVRWPESVWAGLFGAITFGIGLDALTRIRGEL